MNEEQRLRNEVDRLNDIIRLFCDPGVQACTDIGMGWFEIAAETDPEKFKKILTLHKHSKE
jgi:hypothetical protein